MNADGSGITNLSNSPDSDEYSPAWSPDGQKIAFTTSFYSPTSGFQNDLFVMNVNGTGVRRITYGIGAYEPEWSPDGSKIAYVSEWEGSA